MFCASPTAEIHHPPSTQGHCLPAPSLSSAPPIPPPRTGSSLKGEQRHRHMLGLELWPHHLLSPAASSSSPRSHLYLCSSRVGFSFTRASSQPGAVGLQSHFRAEHLRLENLADRWPQSSKAGNQTMAYLPAFNSQLSAQRISYRGKREYGSRTTTGYPQSPASSLGVGGVAQQPRMFRQIPETEIRCYERCLQKKSPPPSLSATKGWARGGGQRKMRGTPGTFRLENMTVLFQVQSEKGFFSF